MVMKTHHVGLSLLLLAIAGCTHQNPPEVVELLNEWRTNYDELRKENAEWQEWYDTTQKIVDDTPIEVQIDDPRFKEWYAARNARVDEHFKTTAVLLERKQSILYDVVDIDPDAVWPEWLKEYEKPYPGTGLEGWAGRRIAEYNWEQAMQAQDRARAMSD